MVDEDTQVTDQLRPFNCVGACGGAGMNGSDQGAIDVWTSPTREGDKLCLIMVTFEARASEPFSDLLKAVGD